MTKSLKKRQPRKLSPWDIVENERKRLSNIVRAAQHEARLRAQKWPIAPYSHEAVDLLQTVCCSWPSDGVKALRELISESA